MYVIFAFRFSLFAFRFPLSAFRFPLSAFRREIPETLFFSLVTFLPKLSTLTFSTSACLLRDSFLLILYYYYKP